MFPIAKITLKPAYIVFLYSILFYGLHLQKDKLLLSDVFENFRNMSLKMCEFDPAKFLSAPGLAWLAALRKTKVKIDLLMDIDMLLMVQKGIRK